MQHGIFLIGSGLWFFQWSVVLFILGGLSLGAALLSREERVKFGQIIGFCLLFLVYFKQFYYGYLGIWSLHVLPLELCNFMTFSAIFCLYTKDQWCYELSIFLGIIAPIQAFVSPAILYGSDLILFLIYYIEHILVVFAPIYLTFFLGMRPRKLSWFKTPMAFSLVVPFIMVLNYLFDTNFMFLAVRPDLSHPFNFGDWPLYILVWIGALLASSFVISRCFAVSHKLK